MGLKPDPNNYPNGEKDKAYKEQIADMQKNPHAWNLEDENQVPGVATSHKKADEKAIVNAATKIKATTTNPEDKATPTSD